MFYHSTGLIQNDKSEKKIKVMVSYGRITDNKNLLHSKSLIL